MRGLLPPDWSVLLHLGYATGLQAEQVIDELYQNAADLILDSVISQSKQQSKDFWSLSFDISSHGTRSLALVALARHSDGGSPRRSSSCPPWIACDPRGVCKHAHGSRPVRVVSCRGHGGKPAAQGCTGGPAALNERNTAHKERRDEHAAHAPPSGCQRSSGPSTLM